MTKRLFILISLTLGAVLQIAQAQESTLNTGEILTAFNINDQHGKPGTIDEDVRVLMFSRDMKANKYVKKAFMDKPADYLPNHQAVYLIDVSGMPKFVTKNFAIPKMQKYPYRIYLDKDASLTTKLPSEKKRVTVVHLDKLKVVSVDYADTPAALKRAIESDVSR